MKLIKLIIRIITGLVFIFSGFVKGIDPLGSTYKFIDYFYAFHLEFLKDIALPLAIFLCAAEFIVGFSLVTGYKVKYGIWGVTIFMLIFTPLTFVLALSNPVTDCGCFGDAIKLTNWETFFKNIILSFFVLIIFPRKKENENSPNPKVEWAILASTFLAFIFFSFYNYKNLPLIDFLPYKIGANISEKMSIPEGAPVNEYYTTFFYEKNGQEQEFTLENYPANDTTWKFVRQNSKIIKKGYEPPIHDFSFSSESGEDMTNTILSYSGYSFIMVSKKISEASEVDLQRGFELGSYLAEKKIPFYIFTASARDEVASIDNGLVFCFGDEITLKTMVRANPGFMLLHNGTIAGKWSSSNIPDYEWFDNSLIQ